MKLFILFLFFMSSTVFSQSAPSREETQMSSHEERLPQSITIGLIPGGNPDAIRSQSVVFAKKLQDILNVPVQIYISKNYDGLVQAVKTKKVDFAFLSAMTYVQAELDVPLKVLLKKTWSGPYYYSSLITLKGSPIKSIRDFKNKKVAFVDKSSTSGYLYPQVYLQKNKVTDKTFSQTLITGSHAASIEKLENKEVDIAAVFADDEKGLKGAWNRFSTRKESQFKTLWVSEPIPNDPIVVRLDFYNEYPKFTHQLMSDLIDLQSEDIPLKKISEIMGQGDLMPATSRQYDPVREMNKSLKK